MPQEPNKQSSFETVLTRKSGLELVRSIKLGMERSWFLDDCLFEEQNLCRMTGAMQVGLLNGDSGGHAAVAAGFDAVISGVVANGHTWEGIDDRGDVNTESIHGSVLSRSSHAQSGFSKMEPLFLERQEVPDSGFAPSPTRVVRSAAARQGHEMLEWLDVSAERTEHVLIEFDDKAFTEHLSFFQELSA